MSTRLKRWARAIQQIDLSKRTDPEVAIGYLDSKYRDIAWRYIRILGFERTISRSTCPKGRLRSLLAI